MKNKSAKAMDLRYPANKATPIIIVIIMAIYLWSCVLWGGVTVIYYFLKMPEYSYLAKGFLFGGIFMTVGIVLIMFRLYILQLPFIAIGGAVYLTNAGKLIDRAAKISYTFKPPFGLRYLPVIAIILISLILCMLQAWRLISKRAAEKEEFNNRPSKSILD